MQQPRLFKREDGYIPRELIHYGLDHINAAEKLFETSPSYYDSAGYLVHKGFELILKAWHLELFGEFPSIHSLTDLIERLNTQEQQLDLSDEENDMLRVVDRYSDLRYPNPGHNVEVSNADWENTNNLLNHIWEQTPAVFDEYFEAIEPIRKGGRVLMRRRIEKQDNS